MKKERLSLGEILSAVIHPMEDYTRLIYDEHPDEATGLQILLAWARELLEATVGAVKKDVGQITVSFDMHHGAMFPACIKAGTIGEARIEREESEAA